MSHIAAALAKSKGKNVAPPPPDGVTAVPTMRVGPPANPFLKKPGATPGTPAAVPSTVGASPGSTPATATAVPARPTAPKRTLLVAAAVVAVVVVILGGWLLWSASRPDDRPVEAKLPPAAAETTKAAPVDPAPVRAGPSGALIEKMRRLVITAAAGGGSQRLSVGGKIFEPGDTVVEGLVLQSIENEEIVFRDAEGNLYTRRL